MEQMASSLPKRMRLSIDVDPNLRRRLRLAAARRDLTVRQYVLEAIEQHLGRDVLAGADGLLDLTAASDPVLNELWGNEQDAASDRL